MSSYSNVKMLNLHYKFLKKCKQTYLKSLVIIKNNLRMINILLFFQKNDPAVLYCYVFMVILSRCQIKNFRNNKQKNARHHFLNLNTTRFYPPEIPTSSTIRDPRAHNQTTI